VASNSGARSARERRRQPREPDVGDAHQARSEQLGRAQVRLRLREVAHERLQVLHLRGIEEAQALVNVGANPARFQRLFEILVAGPGTEQDRDVLRLGAPRRSVRVAHDGRLEQPRGLRRHGLRAQRDRRLRDEAQDRRAVTPGARPHRGHRKAIGFAVAKAIVELRITLHRAGERVDEGEQLRHGAEAVGDRPPRR